MRALFLSILALSLSGAVGRANDDEDLWNGKDFQGFYTFLKSAGKNNDPDGVFRVHDGMIHISGKEYGYLATEREYENYKLTLEFKWGETTWPPRETKARDSGLLFHMQGPDKVWPQSIEFQIIEGGTGDLLVIDGASIAYDSILECRFAQPDMLSKDGTRIVKGRVDWERRSPKWKDVLNFRGEWDLERPRGEWNRLELECRGDRFTYWVNGTKIIEGRGAQPAKGRILLQSEGAEIYFRKIILKAL